MANYPHACLDCEGKHALSPLGRVRRWDIRQRDRNLVSLRICRKPNPLWQTIRAGSAPRTYSRCAGTAMAHRWTECRLPQRISPMDMARTSLVKRYWPRCTRVDSFGRLVANGAIGITAAICGCTGKSLASQAASSIQPYRWKERCCLTCLSPVSSLFRVAAGRGLGTHPRRGT